MDEQKCRSCGAAIFWVIFPKSGKRAPMDMRAVAVFRVVRGVAVERVDGFTSHFATCPQAAEWRKPRRVEEP